MLLVRPTLGNEINRLETEFTHGFWPKTRVFYISIYKEHSEEQLVKDEDTSNWGTHQTSINDEFETKLVPNPHLKFLYGHMFFYL